MGRDIAKWVLWGTSIVFAAGLIVATVRTNTAAIAVNIVRIGGLETRLTTIERTMGKIDVISDDVTQIKAILMRKP